MRIYVICAAGLQDDERVDLPAGAEVACCVTRRTLLQRAHAAFSLFAGEVFRADGAADFLFHFAEIMHFHDVFLPFGILPLAHIISQAE